MKVVSIIGFIVLLLSTGCKKFDSDEVDNLTGKIQVIGHGGSGFQSYTNPYPTNSWRSITRAVDELNADGVEVDLQFSADSVWLLYHDLELQTQTECQGCITDLAASTVQSCTYRSDFAVNGFHQEKITDLNRLLAHYASFEHPPRLFLDVRTFSACNRQPDIEAMIQTLMDKIAQYQAQSWVVIESTSLEWLQQFRSQNPNMSLMLDTNDPESGISNASSFGFQGLVIRNEHINKDQIKRAHNQNLEVHIFGVSTRNGHQEAMEKYPDGLQTDNIELLQQLLQ